MGSPRRERIAISQVRSSRMGPGRAVEFCLSSIETRASVNKIVIFGMDNATEQDVSPTIQSFVCRGGLVLIDHPYTKCSATIHVYFGVRRNRGELWCHLQTQLPLWASRATSILSARRTNQRQIQRAIVHRHGMRSAAAYHRSRSGGVSKPQFDQDCLQVKSTRGQCMVCRSG